MLPRVFLVTVKFTGESLRGAEAYICSHLQRTACGVNIIGIMFLKVCGHDEIELKDFKYQICISSWQNILDFLEDDKISSVGIQFLKFPLNYFNCITNL